VREVGGRGGEGVQLKRGLGGWGWEGGEEGGEEEKEGVDCGGVGWGREGGEEGRGCGG